METKRRILFIKYSWFVWLRIRAETRAAGADGGTSHNHTPQSARERLQLADNSAKIRGHDRKRLPAVGRRRLKSRRCRRSRPALCAEPSLRNALDDMEPGHSVTRTGSWRDPIDRRAGDGAGHCGGRRVGTRRFDRAWSGVLAVTVGAFHAVCISAGIAFVATRNWTPSNTVFRIADALALFSFAIAGTRKGLVLGFEPSVSIALGVEHRRRGELP